jgi:hypothetical protein
MLHAVASMLESYKGNRLPTETKIILTSLNGVTPYTYMRKSRKPTMPSCPELRGNSSIETSSPSFLSETATATLGLWMAG